MVSISAWPLFLTTGCKLASSTVTLFDIIKDDTGVV